MVFTMNDRKLIREVSQHRFLFDRSEEDYRDGLKKGLQWRRIGQSLSIPADLAHKRWRDLRDRYVKERKKETQSRQSDGGGPVYKSRWHLMAHLHFLQDTIKHRDNFNTGFFGKDYEPEPDLAEDGQYGDPPEFPGRGLLECSRKEERSDSDEVLCVLPHLFRRASKSADKERKYRNKGSARAPHHSLLTTQSDAFPSWLFLPSAASSLRVPDLSDRMGMEGSPTPTKLEGASNYLTCSPLLSTMPGIQEDLLSAGAGPSSSSQDPIEENAPASEFDQGEIDVKAEPFFNVAPEICDDENSQNNTQSSSDRPSSQSSPTSGMTGPYLLKKETHCATILDQLLRDDTFSDVTLTAEGQSIRAHKIVLCLASAYFRQVLSKESSVQNVIVFRDIKFSELRNLINFIYTGEATVDAAELESFMRTAEMLEVNSLCEGQRNFPKNLIPRNKEAEPEKPRPPTTASKRSHNAVTGSPPTKSRKIMEASPPPMKLPKLAACPSTSSEGASSAVPTSTPVIKSEPPGDDMTVEGDFHRGDDDDDAYDNSAKSPSHYEDHDKSPPIDSRDESHEKVPPGRCPFCPSSHQQPRIGVSLTKHVHLCHPDKAAFPCENCSRVFLKKGSFEAHIDDCIR